MAWQAYWLIARAADGASGPPAAATPRAASSAARGRSPRAQDAAAAQASAFGSHGESTSHPATVTPQSSRSSRCRW
jgi:hypothetical protein